MDKIKKALRFLAMVLLMIFASFGLGITGVFLPGSKERFMNTEIKIEQVDGSEEEDEEAAEVKD